MADQYLVAAGFIQQFKDKPAVAERDVNGQAVRDVTIKAVGSQKLIRITVWPENNAPALKKGDFLAVEGKHSTSGDNNQFHNISAYNLVVNGVLCVRQEREVVNQTPQASSSTGDNADGNVTAPF